MGSRSTPPICSLLVAIVILSVGIGTSFAGPNLVANGDLNRKAKTATPRPNVTGDGVFYAFEGEDHFGRVVVSGTDDARAYRDGLVVSYAELGQQAKGGVRGLMIDTAELEYPERPGTISVWFDLRGQVRPNRTYEYVFQGILGEDSSAEGQAVKVIAPALWVDGQRVGAEFKVTFDGSLAARKGRVRVGDFERQTGTAAIVFEIPEGMKGRLLLRRVVFREIDEDLAAGREPEMPVPVRYIPIEDSVERRVTEVLEKSSALLRGLQDRRGFFATGGGSGGGGGGGGRGPGGGPPGGGPGGGGGRPGGGMGGGPGGGMGGGPAAGGDDALITNTALITSALAELGEDVTEDPLAKALDWLADEDRDPELEPKITNIVAARLYCLARYGDPSKHGKAIARDIEWLRLAQRDDGGWAAISKEDDEEAAKEVESDNHNSAAAVEALREAHFAGRPTDRDVWRAAARYWVNAQMLSGGFVATIPEYGGLGELPTLTQTAMGLSALLATLDVTHSADARSCDQFRANTAQTEAIGKAWGDWLAGNYYFAEDRGLRDQLTLRLDQLVAQGDNPFSRAYYLMQSAQVIGQDQLAGHNVFRAEANRILQFYDRGSGLFAGSLELTGIGLVMLSSVNAPTVLQRVITGGDAVSPYKRDAEHVVRYLSRIRKRTCNWLESTIARPMHEMVKIPILYLSVEGMPDWKDAEWARLREYCFAGGVVLVNIAGESDARGAIEQKLTELFPEYKLTDLPADDPIWTVEGDLKMTDPPKVIGNGLKNFVFIAPSDWSCIWQLYEIQEHPEAFMFMDALLTYTTDESPVPGTYDPTPYAIGVDGSRTMRMTHLECSGTLPVYPGFVHAVNRLMQSNYRVNVREAASGDAGEPAELLWVSSVGSAPLNARQREAIRKAVRDNTYIFMDVVTGNDGWAEALEAEVQAPGTGPDLKLTVQRMPSLHPLYTGQVRGTQGFDVKQVDLRKALWRKRFKEDEDEEAIRLGRCVMYKLMHEGREVGAFCEQDISSGVCNQQFPGVKGPMPDYARKLAMNVALRAMERRLDERGQAEPGAPVQREQAPRKNWWIEKAKKLVGS